MWAIGVLWVAPAVFVVAAHLLLPDHNASGQCEGIGFGCATTPADTVLLLVLASPFLLLAGVIAMQRSQSGRPRGIIPPSTKTSEGDRHLPSLPP